MTPPPAERGFTLVEMVVALVIFALLASAGVGLLRASVDTQEKVGEALADLGSAARLRTLLQADLAQVVVRPVAGAPTGFAGEGSSLLLVRAFDPAGRESGSTGLQVVRWSLAQGSLVRQSLTPAGALQGPSAALSGEVASLQFRYRGADGSWRSTWSDPGLPAAVEVAVQRRGEAPVTLVVALPQGPRVAAQAVPVRAP